MKNLIYNFWIALLGLSLLMLNNDLSKLKNEINTHKEEITELCNDINELKCEVDSLMIDAELATYNLNRNDILEAIMFVESRNNDSAYASGEDAVGCLQIRKCMVDDVNRILSRKKSNIRFTYDDRWSRKKSIEMFNIFITYYNLNTAEEMARGWNGGPRGINKTTTLEYWGKVEAELMS